LLWQQLGLKYGKYNNNCDFSKGTEDILMKLNIWIDGSIEVILDFREYITSCPIHGAAATSSRFLIIVFTLSHYKFVLS
jgi:hypothetical protein